MDAPSPLLERSDDRCPQCGHEVGDAWLVCAWCGEQLAVAAELPGGARLGDGRYQVLRVIGRGGFGITYDVGDRRLQRRVAMKELFPESAVRHGSVVLTPPHGRADFRAARDRFLREARVLARFTHPGIVRVYEVFEEHGTAYLVMELLEGRTLVDLLQQRGEPFGDAEVLDVAGRVGAALRPVHAAGVLHRDVNPSNVMMTHHGRIVVIDFGLARDYDQDQTVGMTRMVTPGYAPIEQYRGEGRFGPATDVYGLAATCYRLATGKVPVSAMEREGGADLPAPHALNPEISKPVGDAILDGLELEPSHRPQDVDSFLARMGVRRLPDGPRSVLLDMVPAPVPAHPVRSARAAPGGARAVQGPPPDVAPPDDPAPDRAPAGAAPLVHGAAPAASEPVTGETEIVPRRTPAPVDAALDGRTSVADTALAAAAGAGAHGLGSDPDRTRLPSDLDVTVAPGAPDPRRGLQVPPPVVAPPKAPRPPADHDRRSLGPSVMGPHRLGRRKLLVPLTAVALAVASAAPVLATAVVVLVALPWIATVGDSVAHRLRSEHGVSAGWAEQRMAPGALAPARFVRNAFMSLLRAIPMIGVGAVLLAVWYVLERVDAPGAALDAYLRVTGVLVVGTIVMLGRDGGHRFRTALGLDELTRRWVPEGRTTERLVVGWVVAVAIVASAIWLTPDPFPLP